MNGNDLQHTEKYRHENRLYDEWELFPDILSKMYFLISIFFYLDETFQIYQTKPSMTNLLVFLM